MNTKILHSKWIDNFCFTVKKPFVTRHCTTLTPPSLFFTVTALPCVEKIPLINQVYTNTPDPLVTQEKVFSKVAGDSTREIYGTSSPEIKYIKLKFPLFPRYSIYL